jgi:hypothetical protein
MVPDPRGRVTGDGGRPWSGHLPGTRPHGTRPPPSRRPPGWQPWAVVAGVLAAAGCSQNWSPAPVDQALAANGLERVEPAWSPNPGAPWDHSNAGSAGAADASATISLGGLRAVRPEGWEPVEPNGAMRRAEFHLAGAQGSDEAVLAVFHFGPGGGGTTAANVERWIGQFEALPGMPAPRVQRSEQMVNGMPVTRVAICGSYRPGIAPAGGSDRGEGHASYSMLGAVVEAPAGPFFLKLTGPTATVERWTSAFDAFVGGLEPE